MILILSFLEISFTFLKIIFKGFLIINDDPLEVTHHGLGVERHLALDRRRELLEAIGGCFVALDPSSDAFWEEAGRAGSRMSV